MDRHVAARIATLLLLLLLAAAATAIATADEEAQGRKLSFLTYQRSPDGSIQRLFGILGRGEDAVSFAAGMTDGDANLMVRSLEDDVEYRGSGTVTQTMVRASSEEGSGAFGIAIGRASTEGDEEARVETEAGAETFGRGDANVVAQAYGRAYTADGDVVAESLSKAIREAGNPGRSYAAGEAVAVALKETGNPGRIFAQAYGDAVAEGGCDNVAQSFADVTAIADERNQRNSVAKAIASSISVARCAFPRCSSLLNGCCEDESVEQKRCMCYGGYCNWELLTEDPFPVWENIGLALSRYCRCG